MRLSIQSNGEEKNALFFYIINTKVHACADVHLWEVHTLGCHGISMVLLSHLWRITASKAESITAEELQLSFRIVQFGGGGE